MNTIKLRIAREWVQIKSNDNPIVPIIKKWIQYNVGKRKQTYIKGHYQIYLKEKFVASPSSIIGFNVNGFDEKETSNMEFSFGTITGLNGLDEMIYRNLEKSFINRMKVKAFAMKLKKHLIKKGYEVEVEDCEHREKYAEARIRKDFRDSWHHKEVYSDNKTLKEIKDAYFEKNPYRKGQTDANGKELHNGDFKYYRDWSGNLKRGIIYHNLNNMWWVICNKYEWNNISASSFFDLDENTDRSRSLKGSRKYVVNKLKNQFDKRQKEIQELEKKLLDEYVDHKKVQSKIDLLRNKNNKTLGSINYVRDSFEVMDVEKYKKYRDEIQKNNTYYEFNQEKVSEALIKDIGTVEDSQLRMLIQLLYPNKLIASGLFQPLLIFNVDDGKRQDPPLEAYNNMIPLVPKILKAAKEVYGNLAIHDSWKKIEEVRV